MKEIYSNINIIGGGLIGTIAALTLSKLGYRITILEQNPVYNFRETHKDQRTVAISEGSKNFLKTLGVWKNIQPLSEPIKKIKIIDRKLNNLLEFDNERRTSNLGYIVENKDLLHILYNNLKKNKNINIFNNIEIKNIQNENDIIKIFTNKICVLSDLNIAADGKKSSTRKILKTPLFYKDYNKKALVVIVEHTKTHHGTAFEYFYNKGPFAILPMKKKKNINMSSIVWTNDNDYLNNLVELETKQLISILNQASQSSIGDIKKIVSKQLFPLSAHINSRFYEGRTIYIGDSAHSFHPIAGQGWNLGIKDLENLYNQVKKYNNLGIDLGGTMFCKEYQRSNYYNAFRLYQITDKLDRVFKNNNTLFYYIRMLGINYIHRNKTLKNIVSDFAMGIN